MVNRIRTKNYKGVYYKEHPTRKNGVQKDKYFTIRYRKDGKAVEEGLGWASEGMTELKAMKILCEITKDFASQILKDKFLDLNFITKAANILV